MDVVGVDEKQGPCNPFIPAKIDPGNSEKIIDKGQGVRIYSNLPLIRNFQKHLCLFV